MNSNYLSKDVKLSSLKEEIRIAIITGEERQHVSRSDTIRASRMSQASFYNAFREPELFRVGQLHRVYEFLKVPEEVRRYG